jgi:hypothetical protein
MDAERLRQMLSLRVKDFLERQNVSPEFVKHTADSLDGHTSIEPLAFMYVVGSDAEFHCWRSRIRPQNSVKRSMIGR